MPLPGMNPPFTSDAWQVQGALVLANVFFGAGSVVGALGLPSVNPLTFALARELTAGLLLLLAAQCSSSYHQKTTTKRLPQEEEDVEQEELEEGDEPSAEEKEKSSSFSECFMVNFSTFLVLGLAIFGTQAGFIVGIKMAGPIAASVWQPSQPIMTAAICMAIGREEFNFRRLMGVLVAFAGCAAMVFLSTDKSSEGGGGTYTASYARYLEGNLLFFLNCLCTSLYVIFSKRMLNLYRPLNVTAWSYNIAAVFMLATATISSFSTGFEKFLCPECDNGTFYIPTSAIPALVYYVLFTSVGSYSLMTWANQYATGTLVMIFSVLQPVTSALLAGILLLFRVVPTCSDADQDRACLDPPSFGTMCGMLGVFLGLLIVIKTEPKEEALKIDTRATTTDPSYEVVSLDE